MQLHQFQTNETAQWHSKDRVCLAFREGQGLSFVFGVRIAEADAVGNAKSQTQLCLLNGITSTENLDDQIDHICGNDQTGNNFLTILGLGKEMFIFLCVQFLLKVNEFVDHAL